MMKLLLILVLSTILIANGRSKGGGGSSGSKGGSKGGGSYKGGSGSGNDYSTMATTSSSSGSDYSSTSRSDDDASSGTSYTGSGSGGDDSDYSNTGVSSGWSTNGGSSGDNDEDERSIYCWDTDKDNGRRYRRRRSKGGRKGGRKSGWKGSYKSSNKGYKSSYKGSKGGRKSGRKGGGGGGNDEDSGSSGTWSTTSDIELSSTDDMEPEPSSTFPMFSSTEDECDDYNSSIWSTTDYMESTDYMDSTETTDREEVDDDETPSPTQDTDDAPCVTTMIEQCMEVTCGGVIDPVCCNGVDQYLSLCMAVNCNCEVESDCVQGTCSDSGGVPQPLCPDDIGQYDDNNTPCECYADCASGLIGECPTGRCESDTTDGRCRCYENPASAQLNGEGQADGLLFGDSLTKGQTQGVLGGMIAGIALIVCCLGIGGYLYCKKKNNKYGNIAEAEVDDHDGRADDIGVEGVAMTATTHGRTELDGEDDDDDGAIGHETGKTQTIIQYDSSDEDDGDLALPENNETKLR